MSTAAAHMASYAHSRRENLLLMPHGSQAMEPIAPCHDPFFTDLSQRENTGPGRLLGSETLERLLEGDQQTSSMLEWWKKTNGLETVRDFVRNYRDHPAGWGALLMIHGIPEVTGRLRNKVENFAIYSALFLACAVAAIAAPPDAIVSCAGGIECEVRKRIFFYFLIVAIVSLMLCIALAMAFGNALNEAARDCDVLRMFSPAGQGFMATRKCEIAYQTGIASTFVAMLAPVQSHMGYEALIFTLLAVSVAAYIYLSTARPLFASASIVEYWKSGIGGSQDPYDLDALVECFEQQASGSQEIKANFTNLTTAAAAPQANFTNLGTAAAAASRYQDCGQWRCGQARASSSSGESSSGESFGQIDDALVSSSNHRMLQRHSP